MPNVSGIVIFPVSYWSDELDGQPANRVGTDHHGGPSLLDFRADGRIEVDQPDFAASRWTRLKRAYRLTSTPLRKAQEVESTRAVLIQGGRDVRWIDQLAKLRNFFAHQATPYLAVDLSSADSELAILKENVLHLDDDSKLVRMSEFNGIVRGFVESKGSLQEHLIKLFESCQSAVKGNSKGSRFHSPDPTHVITDEYNPESEE